MSNIAWSPPEFEAALDLMAEHCVKGLEIAPTLAFPDESDPMNPSRDAVQGLRTRTERRGIELVSMQSLLYGVEGAALFGNSEERARFHDGVARAIRLAHRLGIGNLVMGSPANRIVPPGMTSAVADAQAAQALCRLGDVAAAHNVCLAVEPSPAAYGANFLVTMRDALAFVERLDHPGVTLNFDLGALHMTGAFEDLAALFGRGLGRISHVQLSEPNLAPVPADSTLLQSAARAMLSLGYARWFSIEMRSVGEHALEAVAASLAACAHVRDSIAETNR